MHTSLSAATRKEKPLWSVATVRCGLARGVAPGLVPPVAAAPLAASGLASRVALRRVREKLAEVFP
jgi:hypothetical protein